MKRYISLLLFLLLPISVFGQNVWGTPNYGEIDLDSGFLPDPWTKSLVAGGSEDIDHLGYSGFVSDSPDIDLYYDSGSYNFLTFSVESDEDTILLINTPEGEWMYDDDSDGLDPEISVFYPTSGLYNIWVGTYDRNTTDAVLYVSESE